MEAVIGAFQPVHRPAAGQTTDHAFHQIAPAKRVAGAVQAQDRHLDFREVRVAKLFGLPRRMKRVGEEQEAFAGKSVRREHRSRPSAHRASAENERLRPDFAAGVRGHGGDAFLQARHRVWMAGPFLAVREVETNDVEPALEQRLGHPEHAAVAHVAAGAVRENKKPAAGRCRRGLEHR